MLKKKMPGFAPAAISCYMSEEVIPGELLKPAVAFLQVYGSASLVSLGCGHQLNRIDNHLRLMAEFGLKYYVGIDCHDHIEPSYEALFDDPDNAATILAGNDHRRLDGLREMMRLFPGTYVEELAGINCAVVVCQRVLPDCRWEQTIFSMNPKVVLQEDLHGCERQQLRGDQYVRTLSNIRRFGLRPFRPWPVFPGETNMVLWYRRDLEKQFETGAKFKWLRRRMRNFIG